MLACMFCALLAFSDLMIFLEGEEVIFSWSFKYKEVRTTSSIRGRKLLFQSYPAPLILINCSGGKFHIPPNSRDLIFKPIFKPISKGKGSCKLVSPDKTISHSCIQDCFWWDLKNTGVDPFKFGLHSLRSWVATSAANNGVNDRVCQHHGCWKSAAAKNIYVDDSIKQRLTV